MDYQRLQLTGIRPRAGLSTRRAGPIIGGLPRTGTATGLKEQGGEVQGGRISRPRLAGRLSDALDAGSVLLIAGAGCGKTTLLEQALTGSRGSVAWINCSDTERAPGTLLMRALDAIATAVPGAADTMSERLATASERVDALAATRGLIGELGRLLVEPLVLVFDDAEHLEGADESLRLVGELLRAEQASLRVAVATRRPLELRVAKPRAAGRLTELTATDLAFETQECADLLRDRIGIDPAPEQVDHVMRATEGWPLGIALAAGLAAPGGEAGRVASLENLGSAPDLRSYLSEELLDSLDSELREAAIASSVARVITPAVAAALELPEDFGGRVERAGMLVRYVDGSDAFAYHPLVREFLIECLREQRGEEERRRLHAAVAPAVAETGDAIGAIEHWLVAESWAEAVAAIEREGPMLLRTSPELLARWISVLPVEVQELPTIRMLEGQLEWGAGQHERAVGPLREAVAGYRETEDPEHEWLARFFLAQAVFSAGPFEEMLGLADGWDGPDAPKGHVGVAGVAWYKVLALTALGRGDEAERLADRLRRDPKTAAQFKYLADLADLQVGLPAGGAEPALADPHATIRELERHDPQGRLAISQSVTGLVHLDIGEVAEAMKWFERSQREAERRGLGFVVRDAHLRRASLLAQRGELADAQLELARAGPRRDTGWRGASRHTADAFVAAARGDSPEAVAAAVRALAQVRPGLLCYRVWAALDMAIVLAESGSPDLAGRAIDEAQSALGEQYPGESGHYHRARLIATRAWLDYDSGERDAAYDGLRRCWEEAGDNAHQVVRAHWRELKPILWQALADGAIDPTTVVPALQRAFPGGEALIAFTDHPQLTVRRSALSAALASNHPAVLSRLADLADDPDVEVASAAVATRERLRHSPPPQRFALLGRFRVMRAGWEIDETSWGRPVDARLVRLLLVHAGRPVPEDMIFEALWPGRSASSARRSLHVAVSRARAVLDLPGAETSAIESTDRAYRLVLGQRDAVDAEDFVAAAEAALAAKREESRGLLDRARSLWGGEPLPEERYSDWATSYREQLIDRHIAVLSALAELHARAGEHAAAAKVSGELVRLDPLNEGGHRALMTAYARAGRTGHALRQYLECRRALVEELGVEPAEETSRLQARILAGEAV
jgi:ATP/maltotriose-dependent transcriptional regulator MalT/DNA-binding SARP family transcriptional activator